MSSTGQSSSRPHPAQLQRYIRQSHRVLTERQAGCAPKRDHGEPLTSYPYSGEAVFSVTRLTIQHTRFADGSAPEFVSKITGPNGASRDVDGEPIGVFSGPWTGIGGFLSANTGEWTQLTPPIFFQREQP